MNVYANNATWQNVSIPNVCTFKIPDTMEIQAGKYKIISDGLQKEIFELPVDSTRVIAQQKGLNKYSKEAFKEKNYARVMIETDYGQNGDYENIRTPLTATAFELNELSMLYRDEIVKVFTQLSAKGKIKQKLLAWYPLKIVNINGISMIKVSYQRSVNNAKPVLVNIYVVNNNDRLHRITVSYKIENAVNYKNDLDKVIETFTFVQQ